MLACAPNGARICLKCQLRLTAGRVPLSRVREEKDSALPRQARWSSSDQQLETRRGLTKRSKRTLYPHGRLLGAKGGDQYRVGAARLGTESLGKPSEVILLRDAKLHYRDEAVPLTEVKKEENKRAYNVSGLFDEIHHERVVESKENVNRNIETLRPHNSLRRVLSEQNFNDVAKNLYDGFTVPQLQHYINIFRETEVGKIHTEEGAELLEDTEGPGILNRTDWTPGVTPFHGQRLDRFKKPTLPNKFTRKQTLVTEDVMRNCWKLAIQEEIESNGELELQLRSREMKFLLNNNRTLLEQSSQRHNAKVDVSADDGIIRVTANKANSILVVKNISLVLRRIHRLDIDLRPLSMLPVKAKGGHRTFEQATINAVSRITLTEIEEMKDEAKLAIYYLGPGTSGGEDARRLLLSTIDTPFGSTRELLHYDPESLTSTSDILCVVGTSSDMPFNVRQRKWARWIRPRKKPEKGETSMKGMSNDAVEDQKRDSGVFEEIRKILAHGIENSISARSGPSGKVSAGDDGAGSPAVEGMACKHERNNEISATIGGVLHTLPATESMRKTSLGSLSRKPKDLTPMSHRLSGTLQLLQELEPWDLEPEESFRIRLIPSPAFGLGNTPDLPMIEMDVDIDPETKRTRPGHMRPVIEDRVVDLLLPDKAADLRIKSRSYAVQQAISKLFERNRRRLIYFLYKSNLQFLGTDRLRTPPTLTLDLPSTIFSKDVVLGSVSKSWVSAKYIVTRLEYRQRLIFAFKGYRLYYTTIEAGKMGGRRSELTLAARKPLGPEGYLVSSSSSSSLSSSSSKGDPPDLPHQKEPSQPYIPDEIDAITTVLPQSELKKFITTAYKLVDRLDPHVEKKTLARHIRAETISPRYQPVS
ncbi:MAG: hypothetical protein M1827_004824 [Pycnora praestabilis]|nr:MAG: hypothetical protein M1827_004824 [Pycnora praestabilis]